MLVLIAQRPVFAILSRLCLQTKKKTLELADDFSSTKHKISEIILIFIEKITSPGDAAHLDRLLVTREAYWPAELCTHTHGFNKRREFR